MGNIPIAEGEGMLGNLSHLSEHPYWPAVGPTNLLSLRDAITRNRLARLVNKNRKEEGLTSGRGISYSERSNGTRLKGEEESVFFEDRGINRTIMPFGRSLLQRESLYRVSGEERSPEILILFHSSGSTSNQWRKPKNPLFPGRTLFRPSCFGTGKNKRFFAQLAHSAGPTCISYLAEEASDRLEFLPSWDSMAQDLLSFYMGNIDLL